MPVFHCPLCPLIFAFRTEVEWHIRNEHRSRADEDADLRIELAAARADLDRDRLRSLQPSYARPSVTLLMATTPGPAMSSLDVARLRHLARLARRRLAAEPEATAVTSVEHRLARAVAAAESSATDHGVALLVSASQLAILALPFAPRDRAVVDPRFATRDLEFALQYHPRYRVLVLGASPRLLEGHARNLADPAAPWPEDGSPRPAPTWRSTGRRAGRPWSWMGGRARYEAGCAQAGWLVDERIQSAGAMPLIVVGSKRWRAEFRRRSHHAPDIVADVQGRPRRRGLPAQAVAALVQPGVAAWRQTQQAGRIAVLREAEANGSIAWGLSNAWQAVRDGTAGRVWVEHGYAQPGRRSPASGDIETTNDPAQPGVCDDLVDDLIQMAGARNITVDLVDDGQLGRTEPIAVRVLSTHDNGGNDRAPHDSTEEPGQARSLSAVGDRAGR